MLLYYAGLSYEKDGTFVVTSYEAVREWHQKGKVLFDTSTKKKRKQIAADEKK